MKLKLSLIKMMLVGILLSFISLNQALSKVTPLGFSLIQLDAITILLNSDFMPVKDLNQLMIHQIKKIGELNYEIKFKEGDLRCIKAQIKLNQIQGPTSIPKFEAIYLSHRDCLKPKK